MDLTDKSELKFQRRPDFPAYEIMGSWWNDKKDKIP